MNARRKIFLASLATALGASAALAQPQQPPRGGPGRGSVPWYANESSGGSWVPTEGGGLVNEDTVRTARETVSHSTGTPEWTNPRGFEKDVFTFARVLFKTGGPTNDPSNYFGRLGWWVDYPDADLNFSYRLQTLTSMRTDPDCRVVKLTDPTLLDFPVVIMEHVENMRLPENEVEILHRYLLNGGALLVTDTWNDTSQQRFEAQMSRVLPGRAWTDLTMDHPIFHCVFTLPGPMNRLQVPTSQFWNGPGSGFGTSVPLQWRNRGPGTENMHARALLDDKGRIMVLALLNSDVPDGWEREGENIDYFHTFSEKIAYPLGINIVFYLMTH